MIRAYVLAVITAALLGLWWYAGYQRDRALQAETALADAEARLAQVAEATDVHRAHLVRMERERLAYETALSGINNLEGGDAPLSTFLRNVDGKLR